MTTPTLKTSLRFKPLALVLSSLFATTPYYSQAQTTILETISVGSSTIDDRFETTQNNPASTT